MRVVSDTSPLIALLHLGILHDLPSLFSGEILIPPAVSRELRDVQPHPDWLKVEPLQLRSNARVAQFALGAGESEALALALERQADLVLLDDKAARRLASTLKLPVMGTLGLLLTAKQRGIIPAVRPKLEALQTLPFHISARLWEAALKAARE